MPIRARVLALLLLAASTTTCARPGARGPSVLLITVDTLRADHLGAYGSTRARTPHIDRLAARGTVFENVAAAMPLTRPSHFTMLTSLYPREHGVVNNAIPLASSETSLAEILQGAGYRTGAFVSVALFEEGSGAWQGFDEFRVPGGERESPAARTVEDALEWIAGLERDEAFFAWVHVFEPHTPYAPAAVRPAELDRGLAARYPSLDWPQFYEIAARNGGDVPGPALEHARDLYAAEVEEIDRRIGDLLAGLDELGRGASTWTLLTADHGESFGHGVYFEHSDSLFDGTIRVPLIAAGFPGFAPGTRVGAQASHIDLAPTILVALGLEVPAHFSGRALQGASTFGDRYVLIQHPLFPEHQATVRPRRRSSVRSVAGDPLAEILVDGERVGVVGRDWKLVRTHDELDLFERRTGETQDVVWREAARTRELLRVLEEQLEDHPLELVRADQVHGELLETLRALGYAE